MLPPKQFNTHTGQQKIAAQMMVQMLYAGSLGQKFGEPIDKLRKTWFGVMVTCDPKRPMGPSGFTTKPINFDQPETRARMAGYIPRPSDDEITAVFDALSAATGYFEPKEIMGRLADEVEASLPIPYLIAFGPLTVVRKFIPGAELAPATVAQIETFAAAKAALDDARVDGDALIAIPGGYKEDLTYSLTAQLEPVVKPKRKKKNEA